MASRHVTVFGGSGFPGRQIDKNLAAYSGHRPAPRTRILPRLGNQNFQTNQLAVVPCRTT